MGVANASEGDPLSIMVVGLNGLERGRTDSRTVRWGHTCVVRGAELGRGKQVCG